jgi:site-specific recombinase XerD
VSGRIPTVQKKPITFSVHLNRRAFILTDQTPDLSTPNTVTCTVRKYLTEREVETLMDCARKRSRYGHRDSTMILVAYRHGLRASELCDLQWHQIELDQGDYTSGGLRTGFQASIRFEETRSEPYGD